MTEQECVFKIRNAGTGILEVSRVVASCGCTATLLSEKEIEPGGEADLKVTLRSLMYTRVSKRISVYSNDPDESLTRLTIKAKVLPRLIVEPRILNFKEVYRKGTAAPQWFTVRPGERQEVKSLDVRSISEYFRAEVEAPGNDKAEYRVKVTVRDNLPLRRLWGYIQFFINGETEPCARGRAVAQVVDDVSVSPKRLRFKAELGTSDEIGTITVTNHAKKPLQIHRVESDIDGLELEVSLLEEGKRYALVGRLTPDVPEGRIRGNITIHTNNERQPRVNLSVYGVVE
jgi:hypothetical protein